MAIIDVKEAQAQRAKELNHELLHTASIMQGLASREILDHEGFDLLPEEVKGQASQIVVAIGEFYRMMAEQAL